MPDGQLVGSSREIRARRGCSLTETSSLAWRTRQGLARVRLAGGRLTSTLSDPDHGVRAGARPRLGGPGGWLVSRRLRRRWREVVAGCPSRIRTSVHGSKVRCPTTRRRGSGPRRRNGAEDGTRTRDPHLGKVMLYQLSHFRSKDPSTLRWCREPDSNWRHRDFQSRALPTELSRPDGQPAVGCPSAGGTIPRASRDHQRAGPGAG